MYNAERNWRDAVQRRAKHFTQLNKTARRALQRRENANEQRNGTFTKPYNDFKKLHQALQTCAENFTQTKNENQNDKHQKKKQGSFST